MWQDHISRHNKKTVVKKKKQSPEPQTTQTGIEDIRAVQDRSKAPEYFPHQQSEKEKQNYIEALIAENQRLRSLVKSYRNLAPEVSEPLEAPLSTVKSKRKAHHGKQAVVGVTAEEVYPRPTKKACRKQGKICIVINCNRLIKSNKLCIRHGGGKRCQAEGCNKVR